MRALILLQKLQPSQHNGRPCKQQVLWQRFCARCTISISMCCGRYDRKIVLSDLQGESKASRVRMAGPWFSQMLMIYLPTAGSTTPKPPECYSSGRGKKFLKVPVEAQEMTCQRRKGWREHLLDLSGKEVCCGILAAFQLARQKTKICFTLCDPQPQHISCDILLGMRCDVLSDICIHSNQHRMGIHTHSLFGMVSGILWVYLPYYPGILPDVLSWHSILFFPGMRSAILSGIEILILAAYTLQFYLTFSFW